MTFKKVCLLGIGSLTALTGIPAGAISFTQGDWTLDISGTVNGFYVYREAETRNANGSWTTTKDSAIENGLLPAWLNFTASTKLNDVDIKAHFGFAPGINDKSSIVGLPEGANPESALSPFAQIDTRNAYFSMGTSDKGTIKVGRDIGLFGQTIILSDMTLLGVGGNANAAVPFNTTFGMISHGYMYVGFQPQITYTSPNISGFQGSIGVFHPSKFAGTETKSPGFQGMASYDFKSGDATGKVWGGFVTQTTSGTGGVTANGFELGGKIGVGPFEAVLYGFDGKGLGASTVGAQFFLPKNNSGGRQESSGYFLQGTYKFGDTKVGLSYGENTDKDSPLCAGCKFKSPAGTLGVYHTLNKYITLIGELVREDYKADGAKVSKINTFALGGILFF